MVDVSTDGNITKTVGKLSIVVVAMFAFVFVVMVPLYDVLCDALGINGKTNGERYQVVESAIDSNREIRIQFVATNNAGMPWEFRPIRPLQPLSLWVALSFGVGVVAFQAEDARASKCKMLNNRSC